ncbi:hypothetical protein AVEN_205322-1 [Araneus ventricosus]|uniref:Uncharacterized protein n=1 Tax=Araneus ventricosus TaxID=182803 RepID=A0A4Y2MVZ3_ARAVE|nr:hypothetical protein AVEN_205322-1 [Araneus ventricosus]
MTNHYSSFQNSVMPFGPTNPIHIPCGQFENNSTHPRKPPCSVPFGHIARGSGQLNGSKDRVRSIMSPYGSTACTSFHAYPFNCQGILFVPSSGIYSGVNVIV